MQHRFHNPVILLDNNVTIVLHMIEHSTFLSASGRDHLIDETAITAVVIILAAVHHVVDREVWNELEDSSRRENVETPL